MAGAAVAVVGVLAMVAVQVLGGDDPGDDAATSAGSSPAASTSAASSPGPADPTGAAVSDGAGQDGDDVQATPSPSSAAASTPGSTPSPSSGASDPAVPTEAPSVAVDDLLDDLATVLQAAPDGAAPDLAPLDERAVGVALGELEAQATEYHDQGWRQVGTTRVVWVRGQRALDPSGTTVRVRACLDSTGVRVVDDAGREVAGYTGSRSVNLLDLTAVDGAWKVSARDFPDRADC